MEGIRRRPPHDKAIIFETFRMMDWRPKKLDVYITKKFMMTFLIALLLIVGIVIIFDISEKIDDFVAKEASSTTM